MNELSNPLPPYSNNADGRGGEGLEAQFDALAGLLAAACSARGCLLEWSGRQGDGAVRRFVSEQWRSALGLVRGAIGRNPSATESFISPAELNALLHGLFGLGGPPMQALALRRRVAALEFTIVCVVPAALAQDTAWAIVRLGAANAAAIAAQRDALASREFWRERATRNSERLARFSSERREEEKARKRLDAAIALAKLQPRNRMSGLGAAVARLGPFDGWLIAEITDGACRVIAAAASLRAYSTFGPGSAVAICARSDELVVRSRNRRVDDELLADFESYLCVPLGQMAVVLTSHAEIGPAIIARTEAMAARLRPIVAGWRAEAENQRLRGLVNTLGLRMFAAVDSERARIARDLHDHQAQLLTAVRLALQARPEEAGNIFRQLEDAMRLRIRELRPPTLGRSTLADALRHELRRLAEHGISGRLVHGARMKTLARPLQQLCYQVAREALTNAARHSGATRVEIRLERQEGKIRLTIWDNGKGVNQPIRGGSGLAGVSERLELMGGRLKLQSSRGATYVIAEVPESQ